MSILHDVRSGIRGSEGGDPKEGWISGERRGVRIYINKE